MTRKINPPRFLIATPAYGRDYQTREEVLQAWFDGKDFQLEVSNVGGTYINKDDKPQTSRLNIRYHNAELIVVIDFNGMPLEDDDTDLA